MAWIDQNLENFIRKEFPDRIINAYHAYRTWQSNRYIWVSTILTKDGDLHYEYFQDHVELHLEGKFESEDYRSFAKELLGFLTLPGQDGRDIANVDALFNTQRVRGKSSFPRSIVL